MKAANDEAQTVATVLGSGAAARSVTFDSPRFAQFDQGQNDLRTLRTLQAQFAARGYVLSPLSGDKLLVSQWCLTAVLSNLAAAQMLLDKIGGARG